MPGTQEQDDAVNVGTTPKVGYGYVDGAVNTVRAVEDGSKTLTAWCRERLGGLSTIGGAVEWRGKAG